MIHGIEHSAIASPDTDTLANWYMSVLGFAVETKSAKSGSYMLRSRNRSYLEIIKSENGAQPVKLRDSGLRHLALLTDQFDADLEHLRASDVTFLGEPENKGGNRVVFFQDPDGNILHLIQRENPLQLG